MDVINKKNEVVIQKKYFFQRSNTKINQLENKFDMSSKLGKDFAMGINNKDSLIYHVKTLTPIATSTEKVFIQSNLQTYDKTSLRQFLYMFWAARDQFHPKEVWENYKQKVIVANNSFSMLNKKGYATDRGRIFLKYGEPNTVVKEYLNNAAYPHEIWHYYDVDNRYRDVKFVFYTRSMVISDFELIHSNLPGEVRNEQWRVLVFNRKILGVDIDDKGNDHMLDDYNNPY